MFIIATIREKGFFFFHFLKDYASFPCRMRLLIIASET